MNYKISQLPTAELAIKGWKSSVLAAVIISLCACNAGPAPDKSSSSSVALSSVSSGAPQSSVVPASSIAPLSSAPASSSEAQSSSLTPSSTSISSSSVTASSSSAAPVVTIPAGSKLIYAVNAGGNAVTIGGVEYKADRFSTAGTSNSTTNAIAGTSDDALYQSERYGTYKYEVPVTNASYSLKLHLAELFQTMTGARQFSVTVEGQQVLQNFDLFAEVGLNAAYELIVPQVLVADKSLTIEMTSQIDNATLSGFAIFSNDGGTFSGSNNIDGMASDGCGKTPTLKSGSITLQNRTYALRIPDNYDKAHPYRLIFGLHGATGSSRDVDPSYFGLWALSQGSTIFIAPNAVGGLWNSANDVTFMDNILKQVKADLCIDTSRIQLEGFSQGGAMSWALACARPNVYRAVVVHSGGGVARPAQCAPVAFMSSLGKSESNGAGQTSNSDFFAKQNGCTVAPLPKAPSGGHVCSNYTGCSTGHPTRWCDYDGGHTPSPSDRGQNASWMPQEVWNFLKQF